MTRDVAPSAFHTVSATGSPPTDRAAGTGDALAGRPAPAIEVRAIRASDAGEVLTVQRAAFVQEALIYGDPDMAPLTQTLAQLEAELAGDRNLGCVALAGARIVGALRALADGDLLLIGRIAVAPDQQGRGIGTLLLGAAEERGRAQGCTVAELFTGSWSLANISAYESAGYLASERVPQGDGTEQVFLRKLLV